MKYWKSGILIFIVVFITFLFLGNSILPQGYSDFFKLGGRVLGYLTSSIALTAAILGLIKKDEIAVWFGRWLKQPQFDNTGTKIYVDELVGKIDAIIIPVSGGPKKTKEQSLNSVKEKKELTEPPNKILIKWIIRKLNPKNIAFLYTKDSVDNALELAKEYQEGRIFYPTIDDMNNKRKLLEDFSNPMASRKMVSEFIQHFIDNGFLPRNKIYVDTTGGTGQMSIGAFLGAEEKKVSSICIHGNKEVEGVDENRLLIIDPEVKEQGIIRFISDHTED